MPCFPPPEPLLATAPSAAAAMPRSPRNLSHFPLARGHHTLPLWARGSDRSVAKLFRARELTQLYGLLSQAEIVRHNTAMLMPPPEDMKSLKTLCVKTENELDHDTISCCGLAKHIALCEAMEDTCQAKEDSSGTSLSLPKIPTARLPKKIQTLFRLLRARSQLLNCSISNPVADLPYQSHNQWPDTDKSPDPVRSYHNLEPHPPSSDTNPIRYCRYTLQTTPLSCQSQPNIRQDRPVTKDGACHPVQPPVPTALMPSITWPCFKVIQNTPQIQTTRG